MENNHPINEVIGITMDKVRQMVDANTVVGTPIQAGDGVTIIPISKISFGFGSGGTDFATKNQPADKKNAFGGGAAAGVNIDPIAFLVVRPDSVRLLPVDVPSGGAVEKALDLMPEVFNKVSGLVDNVKAKRAEKNPAATVETTVTVETATESEE